jgi:ABC-type glutathione transport system ATPase component
MTALLRIEGVTKTYPLRGPAKGGAKPVLTALDDVSLTVNRGESFGLVGESGSGKSTLTRIVLGLERPAAGQVIYDGRDIAGLPAAEMRRLRARLQIVFQDPYASLNPRMTVHDIVAEPLVVHRDTFGLDARRRTERVAELLDLVGLGPQHLWRFPHEFSGGQRQRICIARALSVSPEFLILDEPTSALDVSVQAQVLNLLHELQTRLDLTYLFISHDLGVIRYVCDRVALILRGRVVEEGATEAVFERPTSDYARMLLAAMPVLDPDRSPFRDA